MPVINFPKSRNNHYEHLDDLYVREDSIRTFRQSSMRNSSFENHLMMRAEPYQVTQAPDRNWLLQMSCTSLDLRILYISKKKEKKATWKHLKELIKEKPELIKVTDLTSRR